MTKLPKAPLQEAIFELRWDLEVEPDTQQELDLGYELAQGKLRHLIKDKFPIHQRRVPSGFPTLNYKVVHQFWKGKEEFPVIQLGPGIYTVNETEKNYDWDNSYFPLLKRSLDWLNESYENNISPNFINLRYLDSVQISDYNFNDDWIAFIRENLKVEISNNFETNGKLKNININQSFEYGEETEINISINSGQNKTNGELVLIWQTGVLRNGNIQFSEIIPWLDQAHQQSRKLFVNMTKGKFYDSFK